MQVPHRGVALAVQPLRHLLAAIAAAAHQDHRGAARPQRCMVRQFAHRGADGGAMAMMHPAADLLLGHFAQVHQPGGWVGFQEVIQLMPVQRGGCRCHIR